MRFFANMQLILCNFLITFLTSQKTFEDEFLCIVDQYNDNAHCMLTRDQYAQLLHKQLQIRSGCTLRKHLSLWLVEYIPRLKENVRKMRLRCYNIIRNRSNNEIQELTNATHSLSKNFEYAMDDAKDFFNDIETKIHNFFKIMQRKTKKRKIRSKMIFLRACHAFTNRLMHLW